MLPVIQMLGCFMTSRQSLQYTLVGAHSWEELSRLLYLQYISGDWFSRDLHP